MFTHFLDSDFNASIKDDGGLGEDGGPEEDGEVGEEETHDNNHRSARMNRAGKHGQNRVLEEVKFPSIIRG